MDGYVPGTVADIISNKKGFKFKTQKEKSIKRKCEIRESKSIENNNVQTLVENKFTKTENSKKNLTSGFKTELQLKEGKVNSELMSHVEDKQQLKKKKKAKQRKTNLADSSNLDESEETTKKKRKTNLKDSSNGEDSEEKSKKILKKDLLALDNVPSDSEKEEREQDSENIVKKLNPNLLTESRENTVFIGNIPINYGKQKICKVFSKFGEIQNARIRCVPIADINMSKKVAAIKKQFNPKRNSLVAYVKYKSQDSANAALKANGMIIDGHHLRVDLAEENKERDQNKAVFVGGLPFDVEDDELWEFFENCGKINSVRIIRDSHTSMGKGFGYVNFDSTASVELALQLNGQELKKRIINVKRCVKARNKNKLNSFSRKKSNEITNKLLCKKGKKFKEEKKKMKKEKKSSNEFQGRMANMKQKKKKKLSQSARRQRKLVKILSGT